MSPCSLALVDNILIQIVRNVLNDKLYIYYVYGIKILLSVFIPPAFMPRVYSFRLDVCPFVCFRSFVCSFVRCFPSRS